MNTRNDENIENSNFIKNLNKLLIKNHLCYSNIDEKILRKTQQFEQEFFYKQMLSNPNSSIEIEDTDIEKTLDSGSSWMR